MAAKFNTIPVNQLYEYQKLLADPRLTDEQKYGILDEIPTNPEAVIDGNGGDNPVIAKTGNEVNKSTNNGNSISNTNIVGSKEQEMTNTELTEWEGYAFYFDNDYPFGSGSWETTVPNSQDYQYWYDIYLKRKTVYNSSSAPLKVSSGGDLFTRAQVIPFFDQVIIGNFQKIKN